MKRTGTAAVLVIGALLVCASGASDAAAEIYKWVDAQGQVHFQDHPPAESAATSAVEVRPSSVAPPQNTPVPAPSAESQRTAVPAGAASEDKPPAVRQQPKVELYTVSWCGWCKKNREFFTAQGIAFTDYDIEKDKDAAARRRQLESKAGVPFAVVNGIAILGYAPEKYLRALKVRQ